MIRAAHERNWAELHLTCTAALPCLRYVNDMQNTENYIEYKAYRQLENHVVIIIKRYFLLIIYPFVRAYVARSISAIIFLATLDMMRASVFIIYAHHQAGANC